MLVRLLPLPLLLLALGLAACDDTAATEARGYGAPPAELDCSTEPGTTGCGRRCVTLATDAEHCGSCETSCAPGEGCSAGLCGCSDPAFVSCGDAGCVDPRSDSAHCGGCDSPCAEGTACAAGSCGCLADAACPQGQRCVEGDAPRACEVDDRGPFCRPCTDGCGDPLNFCTYDAAREQFCGVDCSAGQSCPSGFTCIDLVTAPGGACTTDADCPGRRCAPDPGGTGGYCACDRDDQCPVQRCGADGRCDQTHVACSAAAPCAPLTCKQLGEGGACVVARNCGPLPPLTCADMP